MAKVNPTNMDPATGGRLKAAVFESKTRHSGHTKAAAMAERFCNKGNNLGRVKWISSSTWHDGAASNWFQVTVWYI